MNSHDIFAQTTMLFNVYFKKSDFKYNLTPRRKYTDSLQISDMFPLSSLPAMQLYFEY